MEQLLILGTGQLARMLALACYPLGIKPLCLNLDPNSIDGKYDHRGDLLPAAYCCEIINLRELEKNYINAKTNKLISAITYETENVTDDIISTLNQYKLPLTPTIKALEIGGDRLQEKQMFQNLGIPTANFFSIESFEDLKSAFTEMNSGIIKTRRMGYDGKGQFKINNKQELNIAWNNLQNYADTVGLISESLVPFSSEISCISVRNSIGEIYHYPLNYNYHREGILRYTIAPYINPELQKQAELYNTLVMKELNYVGILTVEYFVVDGKLLANELAPRVHNSGHWTIEGAVTSQFSNHVRAVLNLPLGCTNPVGYSAMFNAIGTIPNLKRVISLPNVYYHHYNKQPSAGRKLAHINLRHDNYDEYLRIFNEIMSLISL